MESYVKLKDKIKYHGGNMPWTHYAL
jgi:hypothetical protein